METQRHSGSPFFSIIIPTYNRADLLPRALKSVISQTEKSWEVIIVDDGSTDNTYEQIKQFITSDARISYRIQPHKGEAAARNTGICSASGRYITFLDSDDEFSPNHLENRKEILLENPGVKFLYGGAEILGNQYVPDRFNSKEVINLNNCILGGTFFIDRSSAIYLKGFRNISYGSDADLFDRANNANTTMLKAPLPTYIYHHENENSISNQLLRTSVSPSS